MAAGSQAGARLGVWRDGVLSTVRLQAALDEPGGLDALPDGRVVVADTNNHRLLVADLDNGECCSGLVQIPGRCPLTG